MYYHNLLLCLLGIELKCCCCNSIFSHFLVTTSLYAHLYMYQLYGAETFASSKDTWNTKQQSKADLFCSSGDENVYHLAFCLNQTIVYRLELTTTRSVTTKATTSGICVNQQKAKTMHSFCKHSYLYPYVVASKTEILPDHFRNSAFSLNTMLNAYWATALIILLKTKTNCRKINGLRSINQQTVDVEVLFKCFTCKISNTRDI